MKNYLVILAIMAFAVTGCDDPNKTQFGIFSVQENETTVIADGVIRTRSLDDFNDMISRYPNIDRIVMHDMPGSADDDANVEIGRAVYQAQIDMHIEDGYDIASGAVDLFLAGRVRTKGQNTRFGVHAWADGNSSATDYPEDSEEHDLIINYYKDIGMTEEEARTFYFYTIYAAPAEDIHWMTDAEVEQYNMLTE